MRLPPDKIAHLRAGALVAAAALGAAAVLQQLLALHAITILLLVVGLAVGAAVEWAQRDSNARLHATGHLPIHDVSLADLVTSAAPSAGAAVLWELSVRSGWSLPL